VAGCHEHELGAIEGREFLDQLKDSSSSQKGPYSMEFVLVITLYQF
jgi:hypothetical protein